MGTLFEELHTRETSLDLLNLQVGHILHHLLLLLVLRLGGDLGAANCVVIDVVVHFTIYLILKYISVLLDFNFLKLVGVVLLATVDVVLLNLLHLPILLLTLHVSLQQLLTLRFMLLGFHPQSSDNLLF